jgi:hypothetical protein
LRGFCKCSHIFEYATLSKTPHALADGLMLVLKHPVKREIGMTHAPYGRHTAEFERGTHLRERKDAK